MRIFRRDRGYSRRFGGWENFFFSFFVFKPAQDLVVLRVSLLVLYFFLLSVQCLYMVYTGKGQASYHACMVFDPEMKLNEVSRSLGNLLFATQSLLKSPRKIPVCQQNKNAMNRLKSPLRDNFGRPDIS